MAPSLFSKTIIIGVSLFLFLASGLTATPFALADAFSEGMTAYKSHNYERATQLFANAVRQNPNNPDNLFYLGLSTARQKQYVTSRQAFERVIQLTPPDSPLAAKARNNISYLTGQQISLSSDSIRAARIMNFAQSSGSPENYLTHILSQGKVIRFSLAKMPLRVYIADGGNIPGWNGQLKQAVKNAMSAWQNATRNKVSFTQTWTASSADIIVRWQRNFSDNILGQSPFQMLGDTLVRSDITLAVYYPDSNTPIPYGELVTIATHEMGHAIGIKGHSPYTGDVMYYSSDHADNQPLSRRDINTIAMLYKLDADVQNSTVASSEQTRRYFDWYRQGLQAQTSGQTESAMRSYRQAIKANDGLPEAKFNLGALLINEGGRLVRMNQLENARNCFQEATKLYTEIVENSKHPLPSAQENLGIARTNLNLVTGALQH